ncbi:hypothetical protein B0181_02930 [Moraxella caviae]|uniref:Uncharacterized protein n=1 Tax=Moraxella caviae TaxID=34060 RepID=A0A1T0A706_9GAMM|nr:hypothetical protein B0181_02930 [Moraxella caviae]VEW10525.1 Uncharacterised protein [Moraxella caviae]
MCANLICQISCALAAAVLWHEAGKSSKQITNEKLDLQAVQTRLSPNAPRMAISLPQLTPKNLALNDVCCELVGFLKIACDLRCIC